MFSRFISLSSSSRGRISPDSAVGNGEIDVSQAREGVEHSHIHDPDLGKRRGTAEMLKTTAQGTYFRWDRASLELCLDKNIR